MNSNVKKLVFGCDSAGYALKNKLAEHFKAYSIPMDVMIIDMDWHETWNKIAAATPAGPHSTKSGRDEFGQRIGWTGFTWKKELFPNPDNFMEELHKRGIKTSLNLHFNNGIQPFKGINAPFLFRPFPTGLDTNPFDTGCSNRIISIFRVEYIPVQFFKTDPDS